jgi:hypothetical protein
MCHAALAHESLQIRILLSGWAELDLPTPVSRPPSLETRLRIVQHAHPLKFPPIVPEQVLMDPKLHLSHCVNVLFANYSEEAPVHLTNLT